jgi:hypothetical protein
MKSTLPTMALLQIAEILTLILDRILSLPSPWLEALTPLITWLTLHKNDSLLQNLFEVSPNLQRDIARVHKLLSYHCGQEFKAGKISEEEQVKLFELMGTTLISEEYFFIGFLPLQSFIDKSKSINNGQKCPSEKEHIVRCLQLKNHFEDLNCI